MFKFITHRPLWLNLLAGLLLAFALLFLFILSLNWLTHHNESKMVPSVVGKSYSEAEKTLEKLGFEVEIQDSIYVDTTRPMVVLKQIPESDEVVKVNRTVYLTINRAVPPMVEMPNLVGFQYNSAVMELTNLGLKVGDTSYKPSFEKNAVLEQRFNGSAITPGTKIQMGKTISFVLGSGVGNEKFPVPLLVGSTYCEARSWIEQHGLIVGAVVLDDPNIRDSCGAFVGRQIPERFGPDNKFQYIRTGQTIDLFLTSVKPATQDSLLNPAQH